MKKAARFTIYLGLWIVALCTIGMVFTFINDQIQASGFFGDTLLTKPHDSAFGMDEWHEWGARHYWYFWMCFLLFALSVARIVMWCNWYWDREVFD